MTTQFIPTSFKRLAVGDRFMSAKGDRYRKVSKRGAYALLANGRGRTHAVVPFSRSASVEKISTHHDNRKVA